MSFTLDTMSAALRGVNKLYLRVELLAFVLVATHRLRSYFQSHAVRVLTNTSFEKALYRPNTSGKLFNWSIKFCEFDEGHTENYHEGQILADFVAEFRNFPKELPKTLKESPWLFYAVCSSCHNGGGVQVSLVQEDVA